jgi:hypothetical protein
MRGTHHRLDVDVEFLIHVGDLAGCAEVVHADEAAFEADVALPVEFDRCLNRDTRTLVPSTAFL